MCTCKSYAKTCQSLYRFTVWKVRRLDWKFKFVEISFFRRIIKLAHSVHDVSPQRQRKETKERLVHNRPYSAGSKAAYRVLDRLRKKAVGQISYLEDLE